jgi:hypothetical protein
MSKISLLVTVAAFSVALGQALPSRACEECQLRKAGTYLGQFTILGNGIVRTWYKADKKGKPQAMGVTFSETALDGLPQTGVGPKTMPSVMHELALPKEARITGFDHVDLDWNPKGHMPSKIYDVPHFDFHFYMVPAAQLNKITAVGKDLARCSRKPAAKFMPAGYIIPPGTEVPRMGSHAVDVMSPELHGQPFTQTFIYGYYDGAMNFVEPMIARSFLETHPSVTTKIKQPASYPRTGYYPTKYSVKYDAGRREITVALEGLTYRGGVNRAVVAQR